VKKGVKYKKSLFSKRNILTSYQLFESKKPRSSEVFRRIGVTFRTYPLREW